MYIDNEFFWKEQTSYQKKGENVIYRAEPFWRIGMKTMLKAQSKRMTEQVPNSISICFVIQKN